MPSTCSAAGFALEIIPVAFTTTSPAGMLRVTSSLKRSVCSARSLSILCSLSSSFSWSRSCRITPCIDAAMNAEGFPVRGGVVVSVGLMRFLCALIKAAQQEKNRFYNHRPGFPPPCRRRFPTGAACFRLGKRRRSWRKWAWHRSEPQRKCGARSIEKEENAKTTMSAAIPKNVPSGS